MPLQACQTDRALKARLLPSALVATFESGQANICAAAVSAALGLSEAGGGLYVSFQLDRVRLAVFDCD